MVVVAVMMTMAFAGKGRARQAGDKDRRERIHAPGPDERLQSWPSALFVPHCCPVQNQPATIEPIRHLTGPRPGFEFNIEAVSLGIIMQFHSCPLFVSIAPIKKGIVDRFAIFESDNSQDTRDE